MNYYYFLEGWVAYKTTIKASGCTKKQLQGSNVAFHKEISQVEQVYIFLKFENVFVIYI